MVVEEPQPPDELQNDRAPYRRDGRQPMEYTPRTLTPGRTIEAGGGGMREWTTMGDQSPSRFDLSSMDPEAQAAFAMWITGLVVLALPIGFLLHLARKLIRRGQTSVWGSGRNRPR